MFMYICKLNHLCIENMYHRLKTDNLYVLRVYTIANDNLLKLHIT